ncbi:MAG: TetR/AcrR family transcriptional regulator [Sphingorhabdus sp.]
MTATAPEVTKRRIGAESSETRAMIIAATELVIREEGYAAASTRRVALRAGLKPSLVHYYFPTTDDLLLAVFESGAAKSDEMIEAAITSGDPVRALWRFFSDDSRTALSVEYLALAIRRPAIRAKIATHSEAMRKQQVALFQQLLGERLVGADGCPPAGLSVILAGIGRALFMESALGVSTGHQDAVAWVNDWLDRLLPSTD